MTKGAGRKIGAPTRFGAFTRSTSTPGIRPTGLPGRCGGPFNHLNGESAGWGIGVAARKVETASGDDVDLSDVNGARSTDAADLRSIRRLESMLDRLGGAELDDALTEAAGRALMLRAEILRLTVERDAAARRGTRAGGDEAARLGARIELAADRWKQLVDLSARLRMQREAAR